MVPLYGDPIVGLEEVLDSEKTLGGKVKPKPFYLNPKPCEEGLDP